MIDRSSLSKEERVREAVRKRSRHVLREAAHPAVD